MANQTVRSLTKKLATTQAAYERRSKEVVVLRQCVRNALAVVLATSIDTDTQLIREMQAALKTNDE